MLSNINYIAKIVKYTIYIDHTRINNFVLKTNDFANVLGNFLNKNW